MDMAKSAATFKAKDVGIVFRQGLAHVNSVTLEDVYGTLSFEDSPIALDLPGSQLKLPLNALPALTLRLGNMTQKGEQKVGVPNLLPTISRLG